MGFEGTTKKYDRRKRGKIIEGELLLVFQGKDGKGPVRRDA